METILSFNKDRESVTLFINYKFTKMCQNIFYSSKNEVIKNKIFYLFGE